MTTLDVWYSHMEIERDAGVDPHRGLRQAPGQARGRRAGGRRGQGPDPRQPPGLPEAHRAGRRRASDSSRTLPSSSPWRTWSSPRRPATRPSGRCASSIKKYRKTLADEHHPLEEYRYLHMARKVVGRGQRGHPGLGLPHDGRGRAGPVDPPGQGGPAVGAGALRRPERLREPWTAGGGGPATHADGQRHLPRLAAGQGHRRALPGLLHPPAPRLEGIGPRRHPAGPRGRPVRPDVRRHPGPGPRPLGRLDRHRRVPREGRPVRRGHRRLRHRLRRPERAGLRGTGRRAVGSGRVAARTGL